VQVPASVGLNIVTERNCVVARRGGEQREGERPVRRIMTNSIRPVVVASLLGNGEAQMTLQSRGMGAVGETDPRGKFRSQTKPGFGNGNRWLETEWPEGSAT
jgi:hypothetical protein